MAKFDLREFAVRGAEQRLLEIADEARAIFASFPELRRQGRGFEAAASRRSRGAEPAGQSDAGGAQPARKPRKMSAAARKRISDAQKKRWAEYRKKG